MKKYPPVGTIVTTSNGHVWEILEWVGQEWRGKCLDIPDMSPWRLGDMSYFGNDLDNRVKYRSIVSPKSQNIKTLYEKLSG